MLLRFSLRPNTVDILYIVVNTPTLVLGSVGDHDVVGVAEQDFRVELLALANGAVNHLLAPPPCFRLRTKLVGDVSVDLAILLLAFVLDDEAPAVVGAVLAGRFLYLLQSGRIETGSYRLVISSCVCRHYLFLSCLVLFSASRSTRSSGHADLLSLRANRRARTYKQPQARRAPFRVWR